MAASGIYDESEHSMPVEEGNDISSEVDVNTISEGTRFWDGAEDELEDDKKEDDGASGEDDFSRWMKMKKMLAI